MYETVHFEYKLMCFVVIMFKNTCVNFRALKSVVLTVSMECKTVCGLKIQICTSTNYMTVYLKKTKKINNLPNFINQKLDVEHPSKIFSCWRITVQYGFVAGTCLTVTAVLFWDISLGNHLAEWLWIVITAASFGWYYHKFDLMRLHLACSL